MGAVPCPFRGCYSDGLLLLCIFPSLYKDETSPGCNLYHLLLVFSMCLLVEREPVPSL